ncbi:MAG: hypothetical protein Kow0019_11740 [Methanobacteriaceae archaeon]
MTETLEQVFNDIKNAFLENFNDCRLTDRATNLLVEFKNKVDYKWFKENVCCPKNLNTEEYPIDCMAHFEPIGDKSSSEYEYSAMFTVKNKYKLIEMLNQRD